MQFTPDIVERVDTLYKKWSEKKKVLQDFAGILQSRADLEDYYSRSLDKISESLTKLIHGKDSMKDLFLLLRNYVYIQAEQSRQLARQFKNDLVIELGEMNIQELQQLSRKHQKNLKIYIDQLNMKRDEYIVAVQEEVKQINNRDYKPKFQKPTSLCKKHLREYLEQKYNLYLDEYFSDVSMVQKKFEQAELDRREVVKDCVMKYLVFSISVVRNLQYDINQISGKLEQYDGKKDLHELFEEPKTDKALLSKFNFENYQIYLHEQLKIPIQAKKQNRIFDEYKNKQVLQRQMDDKQLMNQYIAELGDEVKNEEVKKVTEQSQEDIDDENVFQ